MKKLLYLALAAGLLAACAKNTTEGKKASGSKEANRAEGKALVYGADCSDAF